MSISSLGVAFSGMQSAQAGLSVVGHNISNVTTTGYTRQLLVQSDFSYLNKGSSATGPLITQVGLGTQNEAIRQIRNKFYDITYRAENSSGNYYAVKYEAGTELNNILGELYSDYRVQDCIDAIWESINELTLDPGAMETRTTFISSCVSFLEKIQDVNDNLVSYQMNLNAQVGDQVETINTLVAAVAEANEIIARIEADGSIANDYRDLRNNLVDQLSSYLDIDIKEISIPGSPTTTRVDIIFDGNELLVSNIQNEIGLKYVDNGEYPFVEPVFTTSKDILPCDANVKKLFPNLETEDLSANSDTTNGSLKALLVSRGEVVGNYTMSDEKIGNYLIPTLQSEIDSLTNTVANLINAAVMGTDYDGNIPTDLNGDAGIPVFIRVDPAYYGEYIGEWQDTNGDGEFDTWVDTWVEDPDIYGSLYTLGNLAINPELLQADGYNKLAFALSGDINDTEILTQLASDWKDSLDSLGGSSINDFYQNLVTDFAIQVQSDQDLYESKVTTIDLAENARFTLSGVSLDEELSYMITFQHAYNAAVKVINVIDGMLENVINM